MPINLSNRRLRSRATYKWVKKCGGRGGVRGKGFVREGGDRKGRSSQRDSVKAKLAQLAKQSGERPSHTCKDETRRKAA